MTKRIALYTRVSTDNQTTENQRRELIAVAERMGWEIVAEFCDEGISGAKGRDQRTAHALTVLKASTCCRVQRPTRIRNHRHQ